MNMTLFSKMPFENMAALNFTNIISFFLALFSSRVYTGDQVSSCHEESSELFDSFHGEGKGGDDGICRVS